MKNRFLLQIILKNYNAIFNFADTSKIISFTGIRTFLVQGEKTIRAADYEEIYYF